MNYNSIEELSPKINALKQLTTDLHSGHRIKISNSGRWHFSNSKPDLLDKVFKRNTAALKQLPALFCKNFLDPLEKKSLLFSPDPHSNLQLSEKDTAAKALQNEYFAAVIEASEAIKVAFKNAGIKDCHLNPLLKQEISLKYRFEAENGGLDPLSADQAFVDPKLREKAKAWKAAEKRFPENQRSLNQRDEKHLAEVSRYPQFVNVMLNDKKLCAEYLTWAIRDDGDERTFIEFLKPFEEKLHPNFLSSRISYFGHSLLAINKKTSHKFSGRKKVLTLPFEVLNSNNQLQVKNKNILDGSKAITLNKGWQTTIDKIFAIFGEKHSHVGNVEFFGKAGIKNWNSHKLGYWNPAKNTHELVDLTAERWWEQLPCLETVKKLTIDDVKGLYPNLENLQKDEWVVVVRSSRKHPSLDIRDSHGFLEILIPQADGTYKVMDFGKLATESEFPNGVMEMLGFLANTVQARIYYPDENIFYNFRQHAAWARRLVGQFEPAKLMTLVKDFLLKAREGNVVFQFGWENCAFFPYMIVKALFGKENIPNLFNTSIFDLSLPQPLHAMFAFVRWFPTFLQSMLIKGIQILFGAHRGMTVIESGKKVFKSILTSGFNKKHHNFLPASLHHRILNKDITKKINGVVWFGVK